MTNVSNRWFLPSGHRLTWHFMVCVTEWLDVPLPWISDAFKTGLDCFL